MKRVIRNLLLLVLTLSLCGCSSPTTTEEKTVETSQEQTSVTAENSEEESSKLTGKEITIEEIMCTEKQDTYRNYTLKIRNNTDMFIGHIEIDYQLVDASGDSLYDSSWLFNDVDPGQAVSSQAQLNDLGSYKLSDVVSIKLRSVTAYSRENKVLHELFSYRFEEPIIYNVKDIPMK